MVAPRDGVPRILLYPTTGGEPQWYTGEPIPFGEWHEAVAFAEKAVTTRWAKQYSKIEVYDGFGDVPVWFRYR